jgi:D-alanyl-D-alanine carboxypeptidase/D-alanyl-D-alanine-endopeptidase (penicillin-binding protein 4)
MRKTLLWLCCLFVIVSCSPLKRTLDKKLKDTENLFQDHTGFMLYDLAERKTIYEYNAAKYFTPASNTKIFTLYASLKILQDSIPAINYEIIGDTMFLWGTGDPSFLYHNVFDNGRAFSFLKNTDKVLCLSDNNFQTTNLGAGWAWDDYNDYYSAERSPLPVYGNVFTVKYDGSHVAIEPPYFMKHLSIGHEESSPKLIRNADNNGFKFYPSPLTTLEADIPFKVDATLTSELVMDTLKKDVWQCDRPLPQTARVLYSIPSDSLYRVMMQESDNFIAEQLLLICAGVLSDTLKPEIAIKHTIDNFMDDLPDKPLWVDGSGLSRYNLFTPRSIVRLWEKIYELVPRDRLFSLLAVGGKSGTIKNWYRADRRYIFGKTGSLSNNHSLSGYLVTRKGKTLIFSFMNSNFTVPGSDVRRNMQTILNSIYETY